MPTALPALLRVFGDPTRLRILGLAELAELSVGELSRALGLAQSRVSNHLRVLREHELLAERHVGTSTFVRAAVETNGNGSGGSTPSKLWRALADGLADLPEHAADRLRLADVLASRDATSREFFDRVAGEWDKLGAQFETGQARQRVAANLLSDGMVVADLGCGTGYMAQALAGLVERIVCVDHSAGMISEARKRLGALPRGTTVEFREGQLHELPLATDEVDAAVAGMVLHHLPDLDEPLREMRRVVRPGGAAVVLELAPHREEWMQSELGDRHLGVDSSDVAEAFRRAGFVDVRMETVEDRYCPTPPADSGEAPRDVALPLYLVRGRVPAGAPDTTKDGSPRAARGKR